MKNVCGVIVLYNPEENVYNNIDSYLDEIDRLYVVDNSDMINMGLIKKLQSKSKIVYIDNKGNKGIANALNIGAKTAIKDGYGFLLTMDQDTCFGQGDAGRLIGALEGVSDQVGIVAPLAYKDEHKLYPFSNLVCITSGSLVNLKVYAQIGAYNEKLFIDEVEIEYCLRMKGAGFNLKRVQSVVLKHNLGMLGRKRFLFWTFTTSNHPPQRRYYMIRNRFFVWKNFKNSFPAYVRFEKKITIKEVIKVIVVEEKKFCKLKMMLLGYMDYRKNRYGKYEEHKVC